MAFLEDWWTAWDLEKPIPQKHNNMPVLSNATTARTARNAILWHTSAHKRVVESLRRNVIPVRRASPPSTREFDDVQPDAIHCHQVCDRPKPR
jgi:hypothetical protein